jgi:hypothetical protein
MIDLNKPQDELEKTLESLSPDSSEYELIRSKIDRIQQNVNNIQTANLINEIKILRENLKEYSISSNTQSKRMYFLTITLGAVAVFQLFISFGQLACQ